ncbi:MAG TPA: hypothetical protein DCX06_08680 [Opitutae bacterium]|nr:hypothetical protein [Opitutae bacterium]
MCAKELPPPNRQPSRRLSLKPAISSLPKQEIGNKKPLMDPKDEFPELPQSVQPSSSKYSEIESGLLDLQSDLIVREGLLSEKEKRLHSFERELHEREALLEAHQKILSARIVTAGIRPQTDREISEEELKALEALKKELDEQESSIKQAEQMLLEREDFIAKCENDLIEKTMLLSEREAKVEQREEDHEAKKFLDNKIAQEAS